MKNIRRLIIFRFHPVYFTKRPIIQLIKILKTFRGALSMPSESLTELIKNSAGVITVSSTVAIDSIRYGKPAIVLGNPEFLNSKVISKNLLIVRNQDSLSDIERYIKDYKKIDEKELDLEMKKLYHPYHVDSGEWLKVIIENSGK
jgi:capsule polysaccharide modification protein KpsS